MTTEISPGGRRWLWPVLVGALVVLAVGAGYWLGGSGQTEALSAASGDEGHLKNADGSWKYTNALVHETSPYLLLHAHNPVEWYPWGPEALERARREDKPIFLSVGYSTCYWCHVMERKVFANPQIAALMNQWFVNIKVDREERPDLDQIYMTATRLLNRGHGGWPNSVFMNPDLQPFFAGTYFPPEDAHGRPGFPRLLQVLHQAWQKRRDEVEESAAQITAAIREEVASRRQTPAMAPDTVLVNRSLAAVKGRYDAYYGGFGGAPKFPPCIRLEFLLGTWEREKDESSLKMVAHTLVAMARGGIYDQVGGGFHRYATDAQWQIPHFEKMLYNQAHLAHLYLSVYRATGEEAWRWVAEDIFRFVAREMTDADGGFYSALDAETEAVEGKYYLWTEEAISEILGDEAVLFFEVYDLVAMPEGEGMVLFVPRSLEEVAVDLEMALPALRSRVEGLRARLLKQRSTRLYPLLDDKILTSWNGMMIASYALGYEVLKEESYRRTAEAAAEFVLERMRTADGGLKRLYRHGAVKYEGYLEDYAFFAQGLLSLYRATGDERWLREGRAIVDQMVLRFWDGEDDGFFFTESGTDLIVRIKDAQDSALPGANAVAVHSLLDLVQWTGEMAYLDRARQTLHAFGSMMQGSPSAFTHLVAAARKYLEIAALRPVAVGLPAMPAALQGKAPLIPAVLLRTRVDLSVDRPAPGQDFQVAVHLDISKGWHINANPSSSEMLIPTSLTLNADLPLEVLEIDYPGATAFYSAALDETLKVYQDRVTLRAGVRLKPEAAMGQQGRLNLLLQYQACDDTRCLPPAEVLETIDLEVASAGVAGGR